GFAATADSLASTVERVGALDAVVVALAGDAAISGATADWTGALAAHAGIVEQIHADASWVRAVADYAARAERPVRLVTLTDATTAGGRSRAQASAQLARSARGATDDRVAAFAVSIETPDAGDAHSVAGLAAHLLCSPDTPALSGAELVTGSGWFGLRSHPRPSASITYGGPAIPDWLDGTLCSIVGTSGPRG
ncbi:MAG: oxidoreductase, partial [Acidimicrobiales bacterium]